MKFFLLKFGEKILFCFYFVYYFGVGNLEVARRHEKSKYLNSGRFLD